MKRRILFAVKLFLLCTVIQQLNGQTYNTIISDSVINNLMKHEIATRAKSYSDSKIWKKKIKSTPIPWSEAIVELISAEYNDFITQKKFIIERDKRYFPELKKLTEILSKSDFDYMESQFNSELNNKWNFKTKKGRLRDNPRRKYYSYTIPLFNKEHSVALLYSEFGGCSYCGGARMLVYIKNNNTWKLYKSIPLWES